MFLVRLKTGLRVLLGIGFALAGLNHFLNPAFYISIMPPYLPWHAELVDLSGIAEFVGGVALLVPRYSRLAAWAIIAICIAVFPANLHMAMHSELFPQASPTGLWLRLPFQAVFIAWAYWFTKGPKT